MFLDCTNKGCYANGEHVLDEAVGSKVDGGTVFCIECGEPINVPRTTKSLLKSLGQVRKQAQGGLQFTCKGCGAKDKPSLKNVSGNLTIATCRTCGKQLDIHPSFIQALKFIKTDVEESTETTRPVIKTRGPGKKKTVSQTEKVVDGPATDSN